MQSEPVFENAGALWNTRVSNEADFSETSAFNEFHIAFDGMETSFLKSKRSGRWWMQLPDKKFIPCAYKDYLTAGKSELPERWLRAQERL